MSLWLTVVEKAPLPTLIAANIAEAVPPGAWTLTEFPISRELVRAESPVTALG